MPLADKVLYGFVAGEISEDFYGRTDIGKYDFGLRLCRNFFVDWCGGIKSRSGWQFFAETPYVKGSVRMHPFRATEDDYRLEFSPGRMRVLRYNDYLLEVMRTATQVLDESFIRVPTHNYAVGDLVKAFSTSSLDRRYFVVHVVDGDSFQIAIPGFSSPVPLTDIPATLVFARVYTIGTPYDAAAVRELRIEQSYERFIITHPRYPVHKLVYNSDSNWTLSQLVVGGTLAAPSAPTLVESATGSAGVAFCITAIAGSEESLPSPYTFETTTIDYSTAAGSMRVNWPAVSGATEYNVYRTLILPTGTDISHAQSMGYVGRSLGPQFVDNNIVPDFTKSPPLFYNPFVNNSIKEILVTDGGSSYLNTSSVTVAGGTGFVGYPVVAPDGTLLSITVVNGGENYVSPVVTVSGGTGATFSVELSSASGNYPALCRLFQQRMLYGATRNEPMRIWATKPGTLENFDLSQVVNAGDGYSYQLDSQEVRPIQHMLALRHGLLAFTSEQITLLRAEEGKALSGVSAVAEPQVYKGAGPAEPVAIDLDVIFAQRGSRSINAMFYTEYTNSFTLQDLAVLSKHLFGAGREVVRFAWQSEPHKILWCLLSNGTLLSLTYEREQEVFAWAKHETQGRVQDILVVREGNDEVLYLMVERCLRGRWVLTHERMYPRQDDYAENYFGVDCGIARAPIVGTGRLNLQETDGDLIFSFPDDIPADVVSGHVFYLAGGKYEVSTILGDSSFIAVELRPGKIRLPDSEKLRYFESGEWGYLGPVEAITGLWHLEGEKVSVNSDGDASLNMTVTNGRLTFPRAVYKVSVGLPYIAEAWTLPPSFAQQATEGKIRDLVSVQVRLNQTRGLEVGWNAENADEMKDRLEEDWGVELALRSDFTEVSLSASWNKLDGGYFRQRWPLPAHILSAVVKVDLEE